MKKVLINDNIVNGWTSNAILNEVKKGPFTARCGNEEYVDLEYLKHVYEGEELYIIAMVQSEEGLAVAMIDVDVCERPSEEPMVEIRTDLAEILYTICCNYRGVLKVQASKPNHDGSYTVKEMGIVNQAMILIEGAIKHAH